MSGALAPCLACGGTRLELPRPGCYSMLSDGRVIERPLAKADCTRCGLLSHSKAPAPAEVAAFFDDDYALYGHAPGRAEEVARQRAYAEWIASVLDPKSPLRVLEVGCGNGSLLLELERALPGLEAVGVDPSRRAVGHAVGAGVRARRGTATEAAREFHDHDVALSVNVVEHTPDPEAFLCAMASTIHRDGRLVVICPDGAFPSTELLIFDHLFSFSEASFAQLAARAQLRVERSVPAPTFLGRFRLYLLAPGDSANPTEVDAEETHSRRTRYLEAWTRLDPALCDRAGEESLTCFGIGETALLIRAYAQRIWERIESFTIDKPVDVEFCGKALVPLDGLVGARAGTLLLAVRPQDQKALAGRVAHRWNKVICWDDIVVS